MNESGLSRLGELFTRRTEKGRPGLPVFSVTMNDGLVNREDLDRKQDTSLEPEEHLLVEPGDIAYNTMRMWQGAFGLADRAGMVSPAYVVIRPKKNVDPAYVAQLLRTARMRYLLWAYSYGLTDDRLRLYFEDFAAIPVRVPNIGDQQRIASILGTWDDALSVARKLLSNAKVEVAATSAILMSRVKAGKKVPLHQIAEVRTGLAKGKSGQRDAIQMPYLRVANVQDGRLDLREVKLIDVARDQVQRYALQRGDVLMTEGGDFDKLGRGTVWNGEVEPCLHQNHVFAVRANIDCLDPDFLAAVVASEYGRSYFLGCAKRSTNLASINSSQLKAFPVPLPSLTEQQGIAAILRSRIQAVRANERLVEELDQEKAALMAELFTDKRRVRLLSTETTQ